MADQHKKRPRDAGGDGINASGGNNHHHGNPNNPVVGWQQQGQASCLPGGAYTSVYTNGVYNVASSAAAAAASSAPAAAAAAARLRPAFVPRVIAPVKEPGNVAFYLAQQQRQAQQAQAQAQAQAHVVAAAQLRRQQQQAVGGNTTNTSSQQAAAGIGGGLPFGLAEFSGRPGTVLWSLDDVPQQANVQLQQQQEHPKQQQQQQQGSGVGGVNADEASQKQPAAKKARTSTGSAGSASSLVQNKAPVPVGHFDEKKAEESDEVVEVMAPAGTGTGTAAVVPAPAAASARYSGKGLRGRKMSDGCVVPAIPVDRDENGGYRRPPGRGRKGMEWNSKFGVWVPEGQAAPTLQTAVALIESRSEHRQAEQAAQQRMMTTAGAANSVQPSEQSVIWSMDSTTVRRSTLDGAVLAAHVAAMKGSAPDPKQDSAAVTPRDGDIQITNATLPPPALLDIIQELVRGLPHLSDHDIAARVMGRVKAGVRGSGVGRFLFLVDGPNRQWIVIPEQNARVYTVELIKLRRPLIASRGSGKGTAEADSRMPAGSNTTSKPVTKRIDESTPIVVAVAEEGSNIPAEMIEEMPVAFAFHVNDDSTYDVADVAVTEEEQDEHNAVLAAVIERKQNGASGGGGPGRGGIPGRGGRGGGATPGRKSSGKRSPTPGSSGDKGTPPKEIYNRPALDMGPGWRMVGMQRMSGKYKGHVDNYWYTPKTKKKLRSRTECKRFIETLKDVDVAGDEDKAYAMMKKKKS